VSWESQAALKRRREREREREGEGEGERGGVRVGARPTPAGERRTSDLTLSLPLSRAYREAR
jgi:hypothetical protein